MNQEEILKKIKEYERLIKDSIGKVTLTVFILGQGFPKGTACLNCCDGCDESECIGPKRRKKIRAILRNLGDIALVPEEVKIEYPSCEEQIIFRESDLDLLFVFPESFGSVAEFSQFMVDPDIASKMRIFVPREYHPFYGNISSFLTDEYLKFLAKYGHVYPFKNESELFSMIEKLINVFRRVKCLNEAL